MSIKTNTTDLQALLEVANSLPTAENLDTELSTQDNLIAQITAALEGKMVPSVTAKKTYTMIFRVVGSNAYVTYWDEAGTEHSVYEGTYTVDALGAIKCVGSSVSNISGFKLIGTGIYIAIQDDASITVSSASGGSN